MSVEAWVALGLALAAASLCTLPVVILMRRREEREMARRAHERNVERMAARSAMVIPQRDMGFAVLDRDLRYCFVNPTLAALNGLSVDEHLGHRMADILPELHEAVAPFFALVAARQEPVVDMVRTIEVARGEARFVFTYDVVMRRDEEGRVCAFLAWVREVRPEDELDRAAAHYLKRAEAATERLLELAGGLRGVAA